MRAGDIQPDRVRHGVGKHTLHISRSVQAVVLTEGTIVPPNSIVAGVPGKVVATRNNYVGNKVNAYSYYRNALAYAAGDHRIWSRDSYQADLQKAQQQYEHDLEAGSD